MTLNKLISDKQEKSLPSTELDKVDENILLGSPYSVISKLGEGASATVYKVKDNNLGQIFAIKVMRPDSLTDEYVKKRFEQEAEAAGQLTHPNLVAIYGHGLTENHSPYLIMDYLDGQTLSEVLKNEKRLGVERAINILTQVCEALMHMHMKGLVHRDIKPSNIFLTRTPNGIELVKLVDFGIVKIQTGRDCVSGELKSRLIE